MHLPPAWAEPHDIGSYKSLWDWEHLAFVFQCPSSPMGRATLLLLPLPTSILQRHTTLSQESFLIIHMDVAILCGRECKRCHESQSQMMIPGPIFVNTALVCYFTVKVKRYFRFRQIQKKLRLSRPKKPVDSALNDHPQDTTKENKRAHSQ